MPADVADEVDAHAAGPGVVGVAVQAEGAEVALELPPEDRRRLPAAGVARLLAAEEDEVAVRTGPRRERGRAIVVVVVVFEYGTGE